MTSLRTQQLDQRIDTSRGSFQRLGDVTIARQRDAGPQTIEIGVDHPGWGVATTAHLFFVETWVLTGDLWEQTKYAYDLILRPGPGRFGFHWHDGTYHTHCVDPAWPDRNRHFAGDWIDIFAAHDRFADILNGTRLLTCDGLRAARSRG